MMFRNGMLLIFILWVNFTWAGCRTTASLNITDSINVGEILANEVSFSKSVVFTGISCDTSTDKIVYKISKVIGLKSGLLVMAKS